MASNIIYVSIDGNDSTAQIANPLLPYTFAGAINAINSLGNNSNGMTLMVSNGIYTVTSCGTTAVDIKNNITIIGTGPKNVILNSAFMNISGLVTFSNLTINTCNRGNNKLFNITSGSVTINNCDINVDSGIFISLNNSAITINNCNVTIVPNGNNPIIDGSNGILMSSNSNFIINFNGPLTRNVSIFGIQPGTGFANLNNNTILIKLTGGNYTFIPFYNINRVLNTTTIIYGTGSESLILLGVDILPGSVISTTTSQKSPTNSTGTTSTVPNNLKLYALNLSVVPHNLEHLYSDYNLNNYPLVMHNINWSNLNYTPGPYIRPTPQPVQMPSPIPITVPSSFIPKSTTQPSTTQPSTTQQYPGQQYPGQQYPVQQNIGQQYPGQQNIYSNNCITCEDKYNNQTPIETFNYGNPIRFPINDNELYIEGEDLTYN